MSFSVDKMNQIEPYKSFVEDVRHLQKSYYKNLSQEAKRLERVVSVVSAILSRENVYASTIPVEEDFLREKVLQYLAFSMVRLDLEKIDETLEETYCILSGQIEPKIHKKDLSFIGSTRQGFRDLLNKVRKNLTLFKIAMEPFSRIRNKDGFQRIKTPNFNQLVVEEIVGMNATFEI